MKQPCVYILSSRWQGTLYIGVTSNLIGRAWQWKRAWKIALIERSNPLWKDRHPDLFVEGRIPVFAGMTVL